MEDLSYGKIISEFINPITEVISEKEVWDLGCGNFILAEQLLQLGAKYIYAIDKELENLTISNEKILPICSTFEKFLPQIEKIEVGFISWPANYNTKLHLFLDKMDTIILLSKNIDGFMCGYIQFFKNLINRPILNYIRNKENSLIIYGPGRIKRPPVADELVIFLMPDYEVSFNDLEKL